MAKTVFGTDYDGNPISIDVDWLEEPLVAAEGPRNLNVVHRCYGTGQDLPAIRKDAVKRVTKAIDAMLIPKGYARKTTTWIHGGMEASAPADPDGRDGALGKARRLLRTVRRRLPEIGVPVGLSPYLQIQKSTYGFGFFINAGTMSRIPVQESGGPGKNYASHRLQDFTPDIPNRHRIDEFHYVRLVEDPRYMLMLLAIIEKRIVPWLDAALAARLQPPAPGDFVAASGHKFNGKGFDGVERGAGLLHPYTEACG